MNVEIFERNLALDEEERMGKANRWRFLCWILPHAWKYTHLFDDPPDYGERFPGASNYAGICLRCGKRDLFRGPLQSPQDTKHD